MKRIHYSGAALVVCLTLGLVAMWFIGNYRCLLPERDPLAAASFSANRYMQPENGESFSAVVTATNPVYPLGELHTFDIYDGESMVAKVQLLSFLGLGWQERSFSRIAP